MSGREKEGTVSMSVIRRLPRYYRFFCEMRENGVERVSSGKLAHRMGASASQIRQDLNCFGEFGQQGYGYPVKRLCDELEDILGFHAVAGCILIGVGHLGHAVVNHMDFAGKGLPLIGVFDDSPDLIGTAVRDLTIRSTAELEAFCNAEHPAVAVLCIPQEAARQLTKRLISLGVKAFWNFSHYDIAVDYPDVVVENVHLGDSLMTLSYLLEHQ